MGALSLYPSSSSLKIPAISLIIFSTIVFFLLAPTHHSSSSNPQIIPRRSLLNVTDTITTPSSFSCSSISQIPPQDRCSFSRIHCHGDSNGLINYSSLHFCIFKENPIFSVPFLSLTILFQFYVLVKTAQDRFSVVVTKLSTHLDLSPSMGAVTLLALGNGAPDVFASVAAVRGGHARTGFSAILSAGTFVSALVVGFVAIYAAPFSVDPASFVRDVLFYLTAAFFLFYVYLSAEIFLWQAVAFVGFYLFFVGFVFWIDLEIGNKRRAKGGTEVGYVVMDVEQQKALTAEKQGNGENLGEGGAKRGVPYQPLIYQIPKLWQVPVSVLLKLSIPESSPSKWNRFYQSANIAICPLALLYSCNSFMPLTHSITFLLPGTHLPLWSVVLFASSSLATFHFFVVEKEAPKREDILVVLLAFVMSVFWISTMAGELLNCLATLGTILDLPPALLGLTVLAWGNSVGDLVADVAVAKAGQPAMAMAGCFACPMFNMLFGLGTGLVIETADVYPEAYKLQFHVSIVVAFVFLLLSLMGSLLVVTWNRFRVPRFWGFCLVGIYMAFTVVSLFIAKFSG